MGFFDTLALPSALTRRNQWVCWKWAFRNGKRTKVPIDPNTGGDGRANDPTTWSDYDTAREYNQQNDDSDGIGFVFHEDDEIVGIDLDDMRDPGTGDITETASDIINKLDSFTEISPSGTGFHILVKGEKPSGRSRKGDIEMYDTARFFTMTGNRLPGTPQEVKEREGPLRVVHHKYLKDDDTDNDIRNRSTDSTISMNDHELLQKARNSNNGKKFEALWNGHTSGYESHSEADLALCSYLAFWTAGDAAQMDRLFRESGLYRPKWDNDHSSDGKTYGEMTISKAIQTATDFYSGDT